MNLRNCIFFILMLHFSAVMAQDHEAIYNFKVLTRDDGLGHNHVECIFQDSDGFIWFGTRNGLSRYDGYEFTTYRNSPKENSISGNWVLSINEDKEGNLWIGTNHNGASRFNKKTGTFKVYTGEYGFGNRINKISVLKDSSIWLCTEYGLARYISDRDSFKIYLPEEGNPNSINSVQVFDMIEASDGSCYLATWYSDIQRFDPVEETFTGISYKRSPSLLIDYRKRVIEDKNGFIWISAYQHGLCRYDPRTGESVLFTQKPGELQTNILNGDMMVDPEGNVWVATDGKGINIYNPASGTFSYLNTGSENVLNLPGNQIYSLFPDNQNIIWIGSYDKGVGYYDPLGSKFESWLFQPGDLERFDNHSIISLFQDSRERVWIGTDGNGLYMYEDGKDTRVFRHDPDDPNTVSSDVITSISEDPDGHILAGTYAAGLNRIDTENDKITRYVQSVVLNESVNSSSIWDIFRDSKNRIWLGLLGNGLDLYDPVKDTFRNFGPPSNELNRVDHPNTMVIMEDSDGDLWFGTEGNGVFILDYQTSRITRINARDDDSLLWNSVIRSFFQDSKGQIWIGTEGEGLFILNKKTGTFTRLGTDEGLPDMIIQGILEDESGMVWITTGFGLAMYIPSTGNIAGFSVSDGLSANEFNADAFIRLNDGRMIAGSTYGIDVFQPAAIVLNQNLPRVVITKLEILNREIKAGDTINNRVVLSEQITYTDELELTYRDKIISLEFAALNYTLPEKCRYEYRLKGFDKEWVKTTSSRRMATYSNLKKGNYTFQVRASNNDGKWGNNICELNINVLPPYWATFWFIAIMTLLFLFIIFTIYRTRLNFYKSKFLQQQTLQEKRIIELEKENLEGELKKLTFFRLSRNRVLLELKQRLEGLSLKAKESVKTGLDKVITEIDHEISSDVDWKYLEPQIDRTYNNFLTKLREKHSDLSVSELKIAAYVRMNLSNKEIAEFMHKTVRAVENDRYRLRKKLNLESNDSLQNYLMNF